MLRPGVRLVILDEPCRGLDREQRRELLARTRQLWRQATLLCITHDVGETRRSIGCWSWTGAHYRGWHQPTLPRSHSRATARSWTPRWPCGRGSGRTADGVGSGSTQDAWSKMTAGSTAMSDLMPLLWPVSRLGEAMEARQPEWPITSNGEAPLPPQDLRQDSDEPLSRWLTLAASSLGLDVEAVMAPYTEVQWLVRGAGPALLRIPGTSEPHFLALLGSGRKVAVLGPDHKVHHIQPSVVCTVLCRDIEAPLLAEVDHMLDTAGCRRGAAAEPGRPSCASNSVPPGSRAAGACVSPVARASGIRHVAAPAPPPPRPRWDAYRTVPPVAARLVGDRPGACKGASIPAASWPGRCSCSP